MHQERFARKVAWDFANKYSQAQEYGKATLYTPIEARIMLTLTSKKSRGARIRRQFRSIHAPDEKKRLELRWTGYSSKIQEPTCHSYSQWRGAQTRKPKYTFIILISSWQCKYSTKRLLFHRLELCEDHGYSYEWLSGQKTTVDQRGADDFIQNAQLRTSCCSRNFSTSSGGNSSSTSTSQDLSSTSPAQERSDELAPRVWCGSPSETF